MALHGKKVAVLIEDMYNEYEFIVPYYRLMEAGAETVVVGTGRKKVYESKAHLEAKQDVAAKDVNAADFDGVVIPGGYAPDMMRRDPAMLKLVKDLFEANKTVAAICHAGWVLASADVVKGRKCTCFYSIKDDIIHAGGEWIDEEVVIDGNLITSRTPADLPAFMRAVVASLKA